MRRSKGVKMNERIRELAEQAGFMEAWFSESGDDCEREIKKFADIIIRECAQVADIERDTSAGCGYVTYTDGQRIKKHFGVDV
jgi:hypothetical protein